MRRLIPASLIVVVVVVVALAAAILLAASPDPVPGQPQYTGDNRLLPPADYREWIFLSSGLGMSYSAQAGHEMFTTVFVPQWAYREFMKSGKWPDKTIILAKIQNPRAQIRRPGAGLVTKITQRSSMSLCSFIRR